MELVRQSASWLVGWLVGWFCWFGCFSWLVVWSSGFLIGWLFGWFGCFSWLVACLLAWYSGVLIGWFVSQLVRWFVCQLKKCRIILHNKYVVRSSVLKPLIFDRSLCVKLQNTTSDTENRAFIMNVIYIQIWFVPL